MRCDPYIVTNVIIRTALRQFLPRGLTAKEIGSYGCVNDVLLMYRVIYVSEASNRMSALKVRESRSLGYAHRRRDVTML